MEQVNECVYLRATITEYGECEMQVKKGQYWQRFSVFRIAKYSEILMDPLRTLGNK